MEVIYAGLRQTPEMIARPRYRKMWTWWGSAFCPERTWRWFRACSAAAGRRDGPGDRVRGRIIPDEDAPVLREMGIQGIYGLERRSMTSPAQSAPRSRAGLTRHRSRAVTKEAGVDDLVKAALSGDRHSIARLMSVMERGDDEARHAWRVLPEHGRARILGVTGAPGRARALWWPKWPRRTASAAVRGDRRGGSDQPLLRRPRSWATASACVSWLQTGRSLFAAWPHGQPGRAGPCHGGRGACAGRGGLPIILVETVGRQSEVEHCAHRAYDHCVEMPAAGTIFRPSKRAFWRSRTSWW